MKAKSFYYRGASYEQLLAFSGTLESEIPLYKDEKLRNKVGYISVRSVCLEPENTSNKFANTVSVLAGKYLFNYNYSKDGNFKIKTRTSYFNLSEKPALVERVTLDDGVTRRLTIKF